MTEKEKEDKPIDAPGPPEGYQVKEYATQTEQGIFDLGGKQFSVAEALAKIMNDIEELRRDIKG